ncbi:hypothetical protein LCM20_15680 [Halobacillus litoralis]|uniref:VOC family protein n=1 Tax=Halobacillus litoralis TaxID=45668 RepID=UPI001CD2E0F4|nr:VOC family protein [Halobacillus litoralis]MCA0972047.1 hypothetical protein [Halobacillus litoralis]
MKLHHISVPVDSLAASVDVYEHLGFRVVEWLELGEESIAFVRQGEWLIELIESPDPEGHICFEVTDASHCPPGGSYVEGPLYALGWRSYFYRMKDGSLVEYIET